jgi:hypothetical protein
MGINSHLLERYHNEGNSFLNCIINDNEIWIHHHTKQGRQKVFLSCMIKLDLILLHRKTEGVLVLYDKARPHTATHTREML